MNAQDSWRVSNPNQLKVLDLGTQIGGPVVATLLGDLGADVIKVEQPGTGDPLRAADGMSPRWQVESRNKRSITLDLRVAKGQELLRRLVRNADILVENFRAGTMARWGLGFDNLSQINPRLVMVSVSGYGQEGPRSNLPGYDHTGAAFGGLTYVTGPSDRPPSLPGLSIVDYSTAMLATVGALEAVRRRDGVGGSGKGEWVQCALYETVLRLQGANLVNYSVTQHVPERCGGMPVGDGPSSSPQNFTYRTRDGKWLASNTVSDSQFRRLAALIGHPRLAAPDFATRPGRFKHASELYRYYSDWIARHDRDEALRLLGEADVPASPVNSVAELSADPHIRARNDLIAIENANGNTVTMPTVYPRMVRNPGAVRWAGEKLGASNEKVYMDVLGLSSQEFAALKEEKVI